MSRHIKETSIVITMCLSFKLIAKCRYIVIDQAKVVWYVKLTIMTFWLTVSSNGEWCMHRSKRHHPFNIPSLAWFLFGFVRFPHFLYVTLNNRLWDIWILVNSCCLKKKVCQFHLLSPWIRKSKIIINLITNILELCRCEYEQQLYLKNCLRIILHRR